jgi:hypothetical protein
MLHRKIKIQFRLAMTLIGFLNGTAVARATHVIWCNKEKCSTIAKC